ncbi:MAG: tetratricopeptide repeat protein [Saprospiraceae bacterium]|nr:tetratricopeptide repeat protein [Saprospiraceae bacterium]
MIKKLILGLNMLFFSVLISNAQTLEEGIAQLENENYDAALKIFMKLNASNPKNSLYAYYMGEVHYATENYAGAKDSYSAGLAANPKSDECKIGLGKLALDANNMMEAKKNFESALKGNSKNHAIIAKVGAAHLYNRNPQATKALQYFTEARDLDPKVAKYWIYKGDAHYANNELGPAMTAYETAVEKNKSEPETYMKIAKIWNSSGKYDLAIEKLENVIKLNPNYALAYKELYESYIKSRKFDKVLPILEKYVSLTGSDVGAKVRLVKFLCFQAKDYERAIVEGKQLITSNPEEYTINRWLAWSYFETGKFAESYSSNQMLMNVASTDTLKKLYGSDYEYMAKAAFKLNRLDTAEWAYLKVIELDPSRELDITALMAKAFYDAKNYAKAESWYVKKNGFKALNNSELYFLGLSQYNSEAYSRADSSFTKLLEITPNYALGWLYRARCNYELDPGNVNFLAKPYYEKYVEIASLDTKAASTVKNLITANDYLAFYYVQKDDLVLAKMHYGKILELDPTNTTAIDNLNKLNKR